MGGRGSAGSPGIVDGRYRLVPDGTGTLMRLIHTGLSPDRIDVHRYGWEHCVGRLAAVAEGRE